MTQASANLNIMIKAARRASRGLLRDFNEVENLQVSSKSAGDFVSKADLKAEEKVLDDLVGNKASVATRVRIRKRLRNGDLDDNEIEIAAKNTSSGIHSYEIPGMPGGNVGMVNRGDLLGKSM